MKIFRDESGQTLVVAAVFMALLSCGFMALALDVGNLYREKRIAQSTANAAAMVAATELGVKNTGLEQSAADAVALLNGITTSVKLTSPTTGNYQGPYVTATVSIPVKTFFLGAFSSAKSTMTVSASATAGGGTGGGGNNLGQSGICSNGNITISGGSTVDVGNLGIFDSNSSATVSISGGSHVTAGTLAAAGYFETRKDGMVGNNWVSYPTSIYNNGDSINITTVSPSVTGLTCNPVLPPAPPFDPSSCVSKDPGYYMADGSTRQGHGSNVETDYTVGPASPSGVACYKNLTIGPNANIAYMNPGVYVINGGTLHFVSGRNNVSNTGGNGVFIYLTNGANLLIDNGANVNLVAGNSKAKDGSTTPDLGVYNSVTFYEPSTDTNAMSFQGGSSTYMNGSIIAPAAAVTLGNGSGSTTDGGVTAGSFTATGGGTVKITADDDGAVGGVNNPVVFNSKPILVQ